MTTLSEKSSLYLETAQKALKAKGWKSNLLDGLESWGLPTKKNEDYKYTNLENSLCEKVTLSKDSTFSKNDIEKLVSQVPGDNKIVFLNGTLQKESCSFKDDLVLEGYEAAVLGKTADLFDGFTQIMTENPIEIT
ncbi:MAG: hypothetical protein NXH75_15320, partial [Halobacteriovoraceae bacterium]|nr:hypothetical protein [Halobacteriovoraceae bacterium]